MKATVCLFFFPFIVFAGEENILRKKDVPIPVMEMFQKKFPSTKKVKWEKEGELYEAKFIKDKKEVEVLLDKEGNWRNISTEYSLKQLPHKLLLEWMNSFYIDWHILEINKVEVQQEEITYQFKVEKDTLERIIIYNERGEFLKEIIVSY